jgi:phosphate transport system protein
MTISAHTQSRMMKRSISWRNRSTKDGFELLLRFQPGGSDLRRVISAIKLSPNIERVGDQATNIAKRARKLNRHPPLPEVQMIVPIQAHAMSMFKDAINAYCAGKY